MADDQIIIMGETNFRNERRRFGIKKEDRRRPLYIVGKTGMGKSTLLLNMIVQDIEYGNGVAVFDPHGDLVERLLDYIPSRRVNETIYFNPADMEYPIAFNPLYNPYGIPKHLVASGAVQVFKRSGPIPGGHGWNTFCAMRYWPYSNSRGILYWPYRAS